MQRKRLSCHFLADAESNGENVDYDGKKGERCRREKETGGSVVQSAEFVEGSDDESGGMEKFLAEDGGKRDKAQKKTDVQVSA